MLCHQVQCRQKLRCMWRGAFSPRFCEALWGTIQLACVWLCLLVVFWWTYMASDHWALCFVLFCSSLMCMVLAVQVSLVYLHVCVCHQFCDVGITRFYTYSALTWLACMVFLWFYILWKNLCPWSFFNMLSRKNRFKGYVHVWCEQN